MELFWLEHKKSYSEKIVKYVFFVVFCLLCNFEAYFRFNGSSFGSSDDYTSAFGNILMDIQ